MNPQDIPTLINNLKAGIDQSAEALTSVIGASQLTTTSFPLIGTLSNPGKFVTDLKTSIDNQLDQLSSVLLTGSTDDAIQGVIEIAVAKGLGIDQNHVMASVTEDHVQVDFKDNQDSIDLGSTSRFPPAASVSQAFR